MIRTILIGLLLLVVAVEHWRIHRLTLESTANAQAATECESKSGLVPNR